MIRRKILFITLLTSFSFSLIAQDAVVKVIDVPELLKITSQDNPKPRLVNFWATWCKPCVKEMPLFMAAAKKFPEIDFIFISLDFSEQLEKTQSFAVKKGMDAHSLYLIDNVDYNAWIDLVSPNWSGAIPATLFIDSNGKELYEKEFEEGELESLLKSKLKSK